jgi:transcriptional regulator with XRE-family HTH domain
MITPRQIRAARGLLDWSQQQLADVAGVARVSIKNIETGATAPRKDTMEAVARAFTDHGVEFLPGNGVRMRDDIIVVFEGDDAEEQLLNDIYDTMLAQGAGHEVLIYGLIEMDPDKYPHEFGLAKAQIERLQKAGITERIIGCHGNTHFVAPWHCYRWLPAEGFAPVPLFIYGSKIALSTDKPPVKSIVIDNPLFADSCRHLFNFAWHRAVIPPAPEGA